MTTLEGRTKTALLVIDVQNDVVSGAWDRDGVISRINTLVDKARTEHVPVIWVQHSDDNMPKGTECYGDSFEDTDLEALLAEREVGRLVVTGAQTDACIRSTLHGALVRGYDTTLVEDAHTTEDLRQWGVPVSPEQVIAHTNVYWSWSDAPGRTGDVKPAAEVDFGSS